MYTVLTDRGLSFEFDRRGTGTPGLLLGGLGCDTHFWDACHASWLAHHDVIALNNRGVGRSDASVGPYSVSQMADDAASILSALDIHRSHVVGASMGAMIALEVAV